MDERDWGQKKGNRVEETSGVKEAQIGFNSSRAGRVVGGGKKKKRTESHQPVMVRHLNLGGCGAAALRRGGSEGGKKVGWFLRCRGGGGGGKGRTEGCKGGGPGECGRYPGSPAVRIRASNLGILKETKGQGLDLWGRRRNKSWHWKGTTGKGCCFVVPEGTVGCQNEKGNVPRGEQKQKWGFNN